MTEFQTNSNRDAWSSIRGYVYQIRYTVLLWVKLEDGNELQCEAGEDLDEVSREIGAEENPTSIIERVLNQVKHREENLTLRDHGLLDCLSSYLETIRANSSAQLRLRYVTNIAAGREQGSSFPGGLGGIPALIELGSGTFSFQDRTATLDEFRRIIASKGCWHPAGSPPSLRFSNFKSFVAQAAEEELLRFLNSVDWATGAWSFEQLNLEVQAALISRGFAPPEMAASSANDLFATVAERLSSRGPKTLTCADRFSVLEESGLRSSTALWLPKLTAIQMTLQELAPAIQETHRSVLRMEPELRSLTLKFENLRNAIASGPAPTADEPPLPPFREVSRERLLEQIESTVRPWLHIRGGSGRGKSQLLSQFVKHRHHIWVDLTTEQARARAVEHLDEKLVVAACQILQEPSWWAAFRSQIASLMSILDRVRRRTDLVIVIDDIPPLADQGPLQKRLVQLADWAGQRGARLLSTSESSVPAGLISSLGPAFLAFAVPDLELEEVQSLLVSYGCPADQIDNFARLTLLATSGHCVLVAILMNHLSNSEWTVDQDGLVKIFSGSVFDSVDVQADAIRRLLKIYPAETVSLLCRLSTLGRDFLIDEVDLVGTLDPAIQTARMRLAEVTGGWIERTRQGRFAISPLITRSSNSLVEANLQTQIHRKVGRAIVDGSDEFYRLVEAAIHLSRGGLHKEVCDLLFPRLGLTLQEMTQVQAVAPLTNLYPPGQVPTFLTELDVLKLRYFQVKVLNLLGWRRPELEQSFDELFFRRSRNSQYQAIQVTAGFELGLFITSGEAASRVARLSKGILTCREGGANGVPGFNLDPGLLGSAEEMLLVPLMESESPVDILAGLKKFFELPAAQISKMLSSSLATDAGRVIADGTWAKGSSVRERSAWQEALDVLHEMQELGRQHNFKSLECSALKGSAFVMADYLDRVDEGLELIESQIGNFDEAGRGQLRYAQACILNEHGQPARAAEIFEEVISYPDSSVAYFEHMRFDSICRLHISLRQLGEFDEALRVARDGLIWGIDRTGHAKLKSIVPETLYLELLAEMAMCYWELGRPQRSIGSMFAAITFIFKLETPVATRNNLARKITNALVWMRAQASYGFSKGIKAVEAFAQPVPGIFYRQFPLMSALPDASESLTDLGLAQVCATFGLLPLASATAQRALAHARQEGLTWLAGNIMRACAEISGLQAQVHDALKFTAESLPSFAPELRQADEDLLTCTRDIKEIWRRMPSDDRRAYEELHLRGTLIALFLGLARKKFVVNEPVDWDEISFEDRQGLAAGMEVLSWSLLPSLSFQAVEGRAAQLSPQSKSLYILMNLVLPTRPGLELSRAATMHGYVVACLLPGEELSELIAIYLAEYLLVFWTEAIELRGVATACPTGLAAVLADALDEARKDQVGAVCRLILRLQIPLAFSHEVTVREILEARQVNSIPSTAGGRSQEGGSLGSQ